MKKFLIISLLIFIPNLTLANDFKSIKKKSTVTNPKIIFPIQTNKGECSEPAYHAFVQKIDPIEKLDAPTGYALARLSQDNPSLISTSIHRYKQVGQRWIFCVFVPISI